MCVCVCVYVFVKDIFNSYYIEEYLKLEIFNISPFS